MTVCGHSYSGLCGACEHLQACRNSELAKVPMTNEEWFCQLNTEEKAKELLRLRLFGAVSEKGILRWLKQLHNS